MKLRARKRGTAPDPKVRIFAARQAVMVSPVPAELLCSADDLATLPQVVRRVSALAEDPKADVAEIVRLAGWDPAMTARLLARANEPRWGQSGLVDSVSRAVAVIGPESVRRLPQGLASTDSAAAGDSWSRSLHAAVAAREIALRGGKGRPAVVFAAGLLLDVGQSALRQPTPGGCERVGAALVAAWGLPECLRACVAYQREPRKARGFRTEVAIAHLATVLADLAARGSEDFRSAPAVDGEAWLRAGLTPAEGLALLGTIGEQARAARRLFAD
jgi:HD-like signal output (HDOD) protein